jgi:hypothetical protein
MKMQTDDRETSKVLGLIIHLGFEKDVFHPDGESILRRIG